MEEYDAASTANRQKAIMQEVKRIKNFESGDIVCPCGEKFTLWFNGGELDQHECKCGLIYKTEAQSIDLVVYAPSASVNPTETSSQERRNAVVF